MDGQKKTNKQVLHQSKPDTSPDAKITKLKLSHFGPIMRRRGCLKKTIMLGKIEGGREREDQIGMDWLHKETIGRSLQELSEAVEDRTLQTSLMHRVTGGWSQLKVM